MKFTITREVLLKPLQQVSGVVEKRQTLPVLANVLLSVEGGVLSVMGTDLEVELLARVEAQSIVDGKVTVPAKKLLDICKALPDGATLELQEEGSKVLVRSGRNKFTLSTLPASEFPETQTSEGEESFLLDQSVLKHLIDKTSFSMAQQDVRYYLNGMLFELTPEHIRTVATDGHRLAVATREFETGVSERRQCILPRKGVVELVRLLSDGEQQVKMVLDATHIRVSTSSFRFTSKLVDGKFPDYTRVVPQGGAAIVEGDRNVLRSCFSRAAILSNEKYRGVRVSVVDNLMTVVAYNSEQEEAEIQEEVDYSGDFIEIGFNVNYVMDVLAALDGDTARLIMTDSTSSVLIQDGESVSAQYVVMPMRL